MTLTEDLKLWYRRAAAVSRKEATGELYFISWWLKEYFGTPTPKINRTFNKLVKLGYFTKKTVKGTYTQYTFTDKQLDK